MRNSNNLIYMKILNLYIIQNNHPSIHSPPIFKPVDDETTNFSSNDAVENKAFIFRTSDYY